MPVHDNNARTLKVEENVKLKTVPRNNGDEGGLNLSINDDSEIVAANERVAVLARNLEVHKTELGRLGIQTRQCGHDAKQYLGRSAMPRPSMPESEFDSIAMEVARDGDVPQRLLVELREAAPVPKFSDSSDTMTVAAFQDERVAIELIARAIELANRDARRIRAKIVAQIVREVHPERQRIGQRLATALVELLCALRAEHYLGATLADQDASLPGLVAPPILRADVLTPEIEAWVREAVGAKWLSSEQRAQLEAVGVIQKEQSVAV